MERGAAVKTMGSSLSSIGQSPNSGNEQDGDWVPGGSLGADWGSFDADLGSFSEELGSVGADQARSTR